MHRPRQQSIPFHVTERLGQHLLADALDQPAQLGEPHLALRSQGLQDEHGPLVGDTADKVVHQRRIPGVNFGGRRGSSIALRLRDLLAGELWRLRHLSLSFR